MLNTVWPFWASWASEVPAEMVIAVAAITKIKILCIFFLDTLDHASSCRIQWLCNRFPSQVSYSMYWGSTMKSACFTHTSERFTSRPVFSTSGSPKRFENPSEKNNRRKELWCLARLLEIRSSRRLIFIVQRANESLDCNRSW